MPSSPLQERTNSPFSPPTALPPSAFSRNYKNAPAATTTTTPKPFRLPLLNAPPLLPPPSAATASRRSSSHSFPRPLSAASSASFPSLAFTSATSTSTSTMDGSSFAFCVDPNSGRAMVSPVKPRPAGGAERGGSGGTVSNGGGVPPSAVLLKGAVGEVESPFGESAPVAASWTARTMGRGGGVKGEKRTFEGASLAPSGFEEDLRFDLDAEPSKRLLPFSSAPSLTTGADPFDPFLSIDTQSATLPTEDTEDPTPSTDDPNADHEEDLEGRSLLSQWTTVSPSPKREQGRKRARTATLSGMEQAQAVGAERAKGRPHSNTISLPVKGFQLPSIPAPPLTAAPSPLIADLPPLPSSASSLAFPPSDVPSSPSRPPPPRRHPSLGTALSSLSLVTEEEPAPSAEEATPPSLPLTTTSSSVSTASTVVEEDSNPLAAALASLLSKEKIDLLPAGLVPLLERVVKEGTAHLVAYGSSNERTSRLAVLADLVEGKKGAEEEDDPMREETLENNDFSTQGAVIQAPPSRVSARLQPHIRTASSCSSLSLSSTSAASTFSSLSLRSHRSNPSFSSTSTTPVPPAPSHHTSSFSSHPSSLPVPYNPHPPYPLNFARPLRFIYETGASTYEEQRAERTSFLASSAAAAPEGEEDEEWKEGVGRGKRRRESGVAAGCGGGGQGKGEGRGGKKRKGLTRGRSVGWADEEEVEESGGKGVRKRKGKEEEEEEDCLYVPRPSRSRAGKLVDEEEDATVPSPGVEEPVEGQEKGRKKGGKRGRRGRG